MSPISRGCRGHRPQIDGARLSPGQQIVDDFPRRRRSARSRRTSIEGLPADAGDARHHRWPVGLGDQFAGPGDAYVHSERAKSFPATSSS
jgi:hypothetical protein